jgi:hypothetical protein
MSFSPYHQTELRVLAKVRARALQSSNAEAGCDRPFYFFQFDVSCAGRGGGGGRGTLHLRGVLGRLGSRTTVPGGADR